MAVCQWVCLSVCLSVYLSFCLSLSVRVSINFVKDWFFIAQLLSLRPNVLVIALLCCVMLCNVLRHPIPRLVTLCYCYALLCYDTSSCFACYEYFSSDVTPSGWLGSKHQLTNYEYVLTRCAYNMLYVCYIILYDEFVTLQHVLWLTGLKAPTN